MKKVMIFGTFDTLHEGHFYLFREAKKHGDYLIVVLARDETIFKVKGRLPDANEKKRLKELESIPEIDKVILGDKDDKYKAIKKFRPEVIVLGYDQFIFTYKIPKILIDLNLDAKIIRLDSFKPEIFKSSIIK